MLAMAMLTAEPGLRFTSSSRKKPYLALLQVAIQPDVVPEKPGRLMLRLWQSNKEG